MTPFQRRTMLILAIATFGLGISQLFQAVTNYYLGRRIDVLSEKVNCR